MPSMIYIERLVRERCVEVALPDKGVNQSNGKKDESHDEEGRE